jgi:hypothetical protein
MQVCESVPYWLAVNDDHVYQKHSVPDRFGFAFEGKY